MHGKTFDRLTRSLSRHVDRRRMLAIAGTLATLRAAPARAAQITPPACGEANAVCTTLAGCCDGLVCVTSAINTNYGVCVTGEGEMISGGTTLISPFSETAAEEAAAIAADAPAASTTSTTTETTPEERRAAQQARREDRRTDQQARQDARQTKRRTRRQDQRQARQDRRERRQDEKDARRQRKKDKKELRQGPKLKFEVTNQGGTTGKETLSVTNHDDVVVYVSRIESKLEPAISTLFAPPTSLGIGDKFLFFSGATSDFEGDRVGWTSELICTGAEPDEGFVIYASFSTDAVNEEYTITCDGKVNHK
jgi:hypothetical protein